jgi:flagellar assembly protein FliH
MSLSDADGEWTPLVPSTLEKHRKSDYGKPVADDPEIAQAFQVLYEKKGEESIADKFAYLYGGQPKQQKTEEPAPEPADDSPDDVPPLEKEEVVIEAPGPDLEKIKEEAWEEGFSKGEKEGAASGLQKAAGLVGTIENILLEITELKKTIIAGYEKDIIDLVLKIAEKVVYAKVSVNSGVTEAIVHALEIIPEPGDTVITVNPEDYDYIEIVKEDFFEKIEGLQQISIVSDPLVKTGGCKIETKSGEITSSVEDRLEAVKKSILETLGH